MRTTLTRAWHFVAACCLGILAPATASAQLSIPLQPQTYHDGAYHISTHGASDGSIGLTMLDGIPPYTYLWSTGDTTAGISGLTAGWYQVVVTDSTGAQDSASVTLAQPPLLQLSLSSVPASCHDVTNGSASVSVSGGIAPYSIGWSTGDSTLQATGLGAGTYAVTVTSSCGAMVTDSVSVASPAPMALTMSHNGDPLCPADTVTLSVSASGGTPPYAYHWDSGAFTQQVKRKMQGQWGMFHVQVTDHSNCHATDSITVEGPAPFSAIMNYLPQANGTPFSCDTCNDATVQLHLTGGTTPYSVLWSTGHTAMLLEGMHADSTYWVTATDANGCLWQSDTMEIPRGMAFEQQLGVFLIAHQYAGGHHVSHAGAEDGSIEAVAVGGMPPYSFLWNTGDTVAELTGLGAGTYSVTVTDQNNVERTRTRTLTAPPPLSATITGGLASCMAGGGQLNAHPNGGTPPYQYAWSRNDSLYDVAFNQSYLAITEAGIYTVHVTDANADTVSAQLEVMTVPPLATTLTVQDIGQGYHAVCFEDSVQLMLTVEGGTEPYSYLWEHGSFKKQPKVTSGGWKHVRVTDAHGCTADDSIFVNMPEEVDILDMMPHVYENGKFFSCDTCSDGKIHLAGIEGGVPPYGILWSDGSTGDSLVGIAIDTLISITITDALGCVFHEEGSLPWEWVEEMSVTDSRSHYPGGYNVSCHDCTDGFIELYVDGGMPPYSFTWADGDSAQIRNGLGAGSYTVTVTDVEGSTAEYQVELLGPQGMSAHISSHAGSCHGMVQGSLHASVTGGTPPYYYSWSHDGQQLGDQWHELWVGQAGIYTLTVTDANGTSAQDSVEVGMGPQLSAWATAPEKYGSAHAGCTVADGTIELHISGGVPPYNININGSRDDGMTHVVANSVSSGWNQGQYYHWMQTYDGLVMLDSMAAGRYGININDATGCYAYARAELYSPRGFRLSTTATEHPNGHFVSCDTCADASLSATATGAHGAVEFIWLEMPEEYAPIKLRGASLFMNDMEDEVSDPWFFDEDAAEMVVATGAQAQGLRPEVMHVLGARDELGCLSQKMFTLERPAPAAPPAPPAWGLHGNDSGGNALEGDGMPWFGTADSTDVVMKANGVPQLRLGADGVTSVEGQLRLGGLEEAAFDTTGPQLKLMVSGDDGIVSKYDFTYFWADMSRNRGDCFTAFPPPLQVTGQWFSGLNRLYTCPMVNVGIGVEQPQSKLHVAGHARSETLSVNTASVAARLTVKGGSSQSGLALEVQTTQGNPSLQVFNNGMVQVRNGPWGTDAHATINLGDENHYIRSSFGKGLSLGTAGADDALVIEEGSGKVGIGVGIDHTFGEGKLEVNGTIRSHRLVTELANWPDYVFSENYALMPFAELRKYIEEHGHLPDIPSAVELEQTGLDHGELIRLQMQKIEELTRYVLELEQRLNEKCGK